MSSKISKAITYSNPSNSKSQLNQSQWLPHGNNSHLTNLSNPPYHSIPNTYLNKCYQQSKLSITILSCIEILNQLTSFLIMVMISISKLLILVPQNKLNGIKISL
jgi:hypothetical protein